MDVLIYAEANATASTVSLPLSQRVRVIALPMLAALKVLAWRDRHSRKPRSDAADLLLILRKYLDAGNAGRLYQEHLSLLEGDDFDFEAAGSWLVGHDIRDQLHEHSARADQIIATLEAAIRPETDRAGRLALASEMMDQVDAERALRLLSALLNGITGHERP